MPIALGLRCAEEMGFNASIRVELSTVCSACGLPAHVDAVREQMPCDKCGAALDVGRDFWKDALVELLPKLTRLEPGESQPLKLSSARREIKAVYTRAEPVCDDCKHPLPPLPDVLTPAARRAVHQAKVTTNPHGNLSLFRDPSKVEQQAPRDAWSANEPVYLFVGKGVFLHGNQTEVDLEAARLRSLGVDVGAIARAMNSERISSLRVQGDIIEAEFPTAIQEMLDRKGQIVRTAHLVGQLAQKIQSTAPDPGIAQAAAGDWHTAQLAPLQKYTCHYCNTLFLMTADSYECPNCGAPAEG